MGSGKEKGEVALSFSLPDPARHWSHLSPTRFLIVLTDREPGTGWWELDKSSSCFRKWLLSTCTVSILILFTPWFFPSCLALSPYFASFYLLFCIIILARVWLWSHGFFIHRRRGIGFVIFFFSKYQIYYLFVEARLMISTVNLLHHRCLYFRGTSYFTRQEKKTNRKRLWKGMAYARSILRTSAIFAFIIYGEKVLLLLITDCSREVHSKEPV